MDQIPSCLGPLSFSHRGWHGENVTVWHKCIPLQRFWPGLFALRICCYASTCSLARSPSRQCGTAMMSRLASAGEGVGGIEEETCCVLFKRPSNPEMDSYEVQLLQFKMLVFLFLSEPSSVFSPSLITCFSLHYLLPRSFAHPLHNNYACLTHFRVVCVCISEASAQLSQQ